MTTQNQSLVQSFMERIQRRNPHETEFLQAVHEVAETIVPFMEDHPDYKEVNMLERMCEPERVIMFRVPWVDDQGNFMVNRGYRVQMNSAIGPYKGGLRFHPTVNLSILKFLAFEQIFKNGLTTLPMGGGKGGSDFDSKGRSDMEVMRFCQSFMTELSKHIGGTTDIPAGDIGVGAREIGFLFGQYKRIRNEFAGVITGKGLSYGGSLIRPEATGYGVVYFANEVLHANGHHIEGRTAAVSGSGNVAQYTIEKLIHLGAKPVTVSDSQGFVHDPDGITEEKLQFIMDLKNNRRERIREYAKEYKTAKFHEGLTPWNAEVDLAFPCATQNELPQEDARTLVKNRCIGVFEGANMPSTTDAIKVFQENDILFAPGKAANAGGVATSGLEMTQNAQRLHWKREEVDGKLQAIMKSIHDNCRDHGGRNGKIDYVKGANVASFVKVADAMLSQGNV